MAARRGRGGGGDSRGAGGDKGRRPRAQSGDQLAMGAAQEALIAQTQMQQALLYQSMALQQQAAQAYMWNAGGAVAPGVGASPMGMVPPGMMPGMGMPMMMHPGVMMPPGMMPMQGMISPGFGAAVSGQKKFGQASGSGSAPRGPKAAKDSGEESNSDEEDEDGTVKKTTTLMIRNMPQNISRTMLLDLLDQNGLAAGYDFVYLPMDFGTQASFGYALINFTSQEFAERFKSKFDGFQAWPVDSDRQAEVARVKDNGHKGLKANIDRYRNSPVMHTMVPDEFKPCLFTDGSRVPFLRPTAKIKAPTKVPPKIRRQWMQQGKKKANADAGAAPLANDAAASQPRMVSLASAAPKLSTLVDRQAQPLSLDEPVSITLTDPIGHVGRPRVDSDNLTEYTNDYSQCIAPPQHNPHASTGLQTPSDYGAYGAARAAAGTPGSTANSVSAVPLAGARIRTASGDTAHTIQTTHTQGEFWPRTPSEWNEPGQMAPPGWRGGPPDMPPPPQPGTTAPGSGDAAGGLAVPAKALELEARNSLLEDRIAELEAKVLALAQQGR